MIDSTTQDELRAKFNPDGSDLRKLQLRMLDMLKYIDNICKENNIKYWLSSGTCLGAVRHGGFIPWDDDCDIEMLDEDYQKFKKIMIDQKDSPYVFQTHSNDKSYFPRFGKLRDTKSYLKEYGRDRKHIYNGIYIDVFPLIKSNSKILHSIGKRILFLTTFGLPRFYNNKNLTSIIQSFGQIIIGTSSFILNALQSIGGNGRLRHKSPNYFPAERYISEIFPLKFHIFEDSIFPIPNQYENYLTRMYGEYNKIPNITPHSKSRHITQLDFY